MNFLEWLKSLKGKWLTIYTVDVSVDENGKQAATIGKLTLVGTDFIELMSPDGYRSGLPVQSITGVYERTDGEKLTLQAMESSTKRG